MSYGSGLAKPRSYAGAVKAQLTHAPVALTVSKKERKVDNLWKRKQIEPKLVATLTIQGKHAAIHNTWATLGEVLPPGLEHSYTRFLVSTAIVEVKIDAVKVKKEMDYLQKCVIIAYFVGGLQTAKVLEAGGCTQQGGQNEGEDRPSSRSWILSARL